MASTGTSSWRSGGWSPPMARCSNNPAIVKGTIRSLATLAYQGGSRGQIRPPAAGRGAEDPAARRHHPRRRMTGSWAGAMGHTQFIPTTYAAYAVDFDGDGSRNIWNSLGDALASTANYLAEIGLAERQDLGLRGQRCPRASTTSSPKRRADARGVAEARHQAGRRQGFPAPGRIGDAVCAGRRQRPGLPADQEFQRHQALQQRRLLCARGRPSRRPAAPAMTPSRANGRWKEQPLSDSEKAKSAGAPDGTRLLFGQDRRESRQRQPRGDPGLSASDRPFRRCRARRRYCSFSKPAANIEPGRDAVPKAPARRYIGARRLAAGDAPDSGPAHASTASSSFF